LNSGDLIIEIFNAVQCDGATLDQAFELHGLLCDLATRAESALAAIAKAGNALRAARRIGISGDQLTSRSVEVLALRQTLVETSEVTAQLVTTSESDRMPLTAGLLRDCDRRLRQAAVQLDDALHGSCAP
jgi:hypothetical protein